MGQEEAGGKPSTHQELLKSVLDVQLKAMPSPSKGVRVAQLLLALVCISGAMFVAFWLVVEGPPTPKTSTEESGSKPAAAVALASSPAADSGSGSNGSAPNGSGDAGSNGSSGSSTSDGEPSEPQCPASADQCPEDESTSSLNEEAPWAFAIAALLVGAFLAAGQSLGFGGGGKEQEDAGAPPAGEPTEKPGQPATPPAPAPPAPASGEPAQPGTPRLP